MSLSSFRAAPRCGNLDRVKLIYGYLAKMRHAVIRIRTDEPDLSSFLSLELYWEKSIYGYVRELIPRDAPTLLGEFVILIHYVDSNLMHCLLTSRLVTGILTFINKTPMDCFSKK